MDLNDHTLPDAVVEAQIEHWLDLHATFEERFDQVPFSVADREQSPWQDPYAKRAHADLRVP